MCIEKIQLKMKMYALFNLATSSLCTYEFKYIRYISMF